MMMKRVLIFALALMMMLGTTVAMASCGSDKSDYETIKDSGKLVIGITLYAPMNYKDDSGKLIGFDTEFAEAVCAKLGVEPDFQVIDWNTKETTLKSGDIDCIWNGLTVTEPRREHMDFSKNYLVNRQCVVINKADADKYTDAASLATAMTSAEKGSAGETAILADENLKNSKYTASDSQATALTGLLAGNYDAIVIDVTLAESSVGKGDYADMMILEGIELEKENYAIGFRLGSDMTEKVNAIIDELVKDGTMGAIAAKYNLTDKLNEAIGQ